MLYAYGMVYAGANKSMSNRALPLYMVVYVFVHSAHDGDELSSVTKLNISAYTA